MSPRPAAAATSAATSAAGPHSGAAANVGADLVVDDVAIRWPTTLPASATTAEVRAFLDDDHVHLALLVEEDGRLVTTVDRGDLAEACDRSGGAPARVLGRTGDRVVPTGTPVAHVWHTLAARSWRRVAVVDGDGRLVGLVCLKRSGRGFCSDAGVSRRRAARRMTDDDARRS